MLGLRKAAPADLARARASVRVLELSAAFGVWARLAVLTAGLWLAIDARSWQGWIIAGLVGWTAVVLLGDPLTGKGLRAMAAEAKTANSTIPASLLARIHPLRLWSSVLTRTGLIAGVITVMVAKPGLLAALGVLLAGYLTGAATARLTRLSPQATTRPLP